MSVCLSFSLSVDMFSCVCPTCSLSLLVTVIDIVVSVVVAKIAVMKHDVTARRSSNHTIGVLGYWHENTDFRIINSKI